MFLPSFIMLTREEILSYLKENKEQFHTKYGIDKIALFGSFARGEQNENSDVDILIDMNPETEDIFGKRMLLREDLKSKFFKEVDICHEKAIKAVFSEIIFKEAIYA